MFRKFAKAVLLAATVTLWLATTAALAAPVLSPALSPDFIAKGGLRFRSFGNPADKEIYAGRGNLGKKANRSEADHVWSVGSTAFSFTVDLDTALMQLTLPGLPAPLRFAYIGKSALNALSISIVDRDKKAELWLTDLVVNGSVLGNVTSAASEGALDFLASGFASSRHMAVSGTIRTSGKFNKRQDLSRIEFTVGRLPEPIPLLHTVPLAGGLPLLLSGLTLLGGLMVMGMHRKA